MDKFIERLPKVELHCHIEGTLEPELMFKIGKRNGIELPFNSVDEVKAAYDFTNLQSFLDIYYQGTNVLLHEEDFYEMTAAYLTRIKKQNVRHTEIFFDPQTHTGRGVPFETLIKGITRALRESDISSKLILCFLRHLSAAEAMKTLEEALPYKKWITAVGLDSSEKDNPPEKFKEVFDRAREEGFLAVAHAGEEGSADYIWQALKLLNACRIDHGVRCIEDPKLVQHLKSRHIPLTVCPLSNVKLCLFKEMKDHNIKELFDAGLLVTINSDDPAYFGGYIEENFKAVAAALSLTKEQIYQIARNGIEASFLSKDEKQELFNEIDHYLYSQV